MTHVTKTIPLPATSPGSNRHLTIHRWGKLGARPKVYIQAALHADELPAVMAACHLIPLLDAAEQDGQIIGEIVLVPNANPIGMAQSLNTYHIGRHGFADGIGNFNRGWPDLGSCVLNSPRDQFGANPATNINVMRTKLCDAVKNLPETTEWHALQKALLTLSIDADYVFDLHCDFQATMHVFANAEFAELVVELGRDLGAPVVILEDSIDAGLFDECNGGPWIRVRKALGLSPEVLPAACFSPTIELRGRGDVSKEFGALDAANILNFLRRKDIILGSPPPPPDTHCEAVPVAGCVMVIATVAGMVVWHTRVGAEVFDGEHIADVVDIDTPNPLSTRTPVYAHQTGKLFSQRLGHMTRPGEILCQIAGKEPMTHSRNEKFLNP